MRLNTLAVKTLELDPIKMPRRRPVVQRLMRSLRLRSRACGELHALRRRRLTRALIVERSVLISLGIGRKCGERWVGCPRIAADILKKNGRIRMSVKMNVQSWRVGYFQQHDASVRVKNAVNIRIGDFCV